MRAGRPLAGEIGVDLSGLMAAERAVAALAGPVMELEQDGALTVVRLGSGSGGTDPSVDPGPDRTAYPDNDRAAGTDNNRAAASDHDRAAAFGADLPPGATPAAAAAIRARLSELGRGWRSLEDGTGITLSFTPGA